MSLLKSGDRGAEFPGAVHEHGVSGFGHCYRIGARQVTGERAQDG